MRWMWVLAWPAVAAAQDTVPGDALAVAAREVRAGLSPRVVDVGGATVFPYGHGEATVACAVLTACVVALAPEERIVATTLGDSERWLAAQMGGSRVAVKPTACGIATNLAIATDQRVYVLALTAAPCAGRAPRLTPYVRFWYPDATPAAPAPTLAFTYHWTHDAHLPWTPVAVYDDGAHVYIRFPAASRHGVAPVLWQETADGDRVLLNYTTHDDSYVTDRVFARAVLEASDGRRVHRVEIVNDTLVTNTP
ncbi:MAG TPA: TrbG/VirB9 family P-type conjugative transfer protein [Gemmatimonadaceae bacterium]|jgi:type IV secretory pathway VirB9-like protein|nr:TrbG/VirB9 family P-type conjugative transfer protein [Gemmatimonadaceae bacterium]